MDARPATPAVPPDEVVAHAGFVRRLAFALLRDDADADDAAQEALARALECGPAVPAARRSWLAAVVRNVAAGLRRDRTRRRRREALAARPEATSAAADLAEKAETLRAVAQAVDALDPDERAIVLFRHYDGLPPRAIAARLGLPVTTVKSRLQRAHQRLRERLDQRGGRDAQRRWRALAGFAGVSPWAPSAGGGAAGLAAKGVAMAATGKVVAAVATAIVVAAGVWLWGAGRGPAERTDSTGDPGVRAIAAGKAEGDTEAKAPGLRGSPVRGDEGAEVAAALPPPVDLARCNRDLDLFGVVVDRVGKPVAGADLRAISYPGRRGNLLDLKTYDRAVEGPRTRSSVDGSFSLRLRRGEHVVLRVAAAGFASFDRAGCTAGQRLRIVLGPPVTLVVALADEGGKPVPDTDVRVSCRDGSEGTSFERHATSDARGRATFLDLAGGVFAYVDPEPVRLAKVMWKTVDLPAEGEVTVDIVLPTGRRVAGRVTDAATGSPIPGARVGINWTLGRAVATGADGRYEIFGWNRQQGATELHVVAEDYGRLGKIVGESDAVDFALDRADTVVGRAVDPEGKPVEGAIAGVVPIGERAGREDSDVGSTTWTAADGRFRLTSLRRDQDHALVLMAPGFGRYLLDFPPRPGGPGEIDLGDVAFPFGHRIEGRVLDHDGSPVANVDVALRGANADRRRLLGGKPETGDSSYGQTEEVRTDDIGRFRFADLAPGFYTLTARRRGQREARLSVSLPDELRDVLDAEIVLGEGREVVIAVSDPAGAPLSGAYVRAMPGTASDAGFMGGGPTDAKGETRVWLPPGEWRLSVDWIRDFDPKGRRYVEASRTVPAEVSRVDVTLQEAGTISGRVLDAAGKGLVGAEFEALRGADRVGTWRAEAGGRFSLDVPKGSPVTLRVTGRRLQGGMVFEPWTSEATAVAVGATDVVVTARPVPQDRALTVVALSPEGAPLAGLAVYLMTQSGLYRQGQTNAAGRAAFSDLTAERWIAQLLPDSAHLSVWLVARGETPEPSGGDLEVRFRVGAAVSGVVVDADGRPAQGARVEVEGPGGVGGAGGIGVNTTDVEGRFRLLVDPASPLPLKLRAALSRSSGTIDVMRLPAENLTLRLSSPRSR